MEFENLWELPKALVYNVGLVKTETSTPENSAGYAEGETIRYSITATNYGPYTYEDIELHDIPNSNYTGVPYRTGLSLRPAGEEGSSFTVTYEHQVDAMDVLRGHVRNEATMGYVCGENQFGEPMYDDVDSGPVISPTIAGETPVYSASIVKEETSNPTHDDYYVEGDTITYGIAVTNTGKVPILSGFVYDALSTDDDPIATFTDLDVGKTFKTTYAYKVDAEDVSYGRVENFAQVYYIVREYEDEEGTNWVDDTVKSNVVESKTGVAPSTSNFETDVTLEKKVTSTPANGTFYVEDEIISYSITATNNGSIAYNSLELYDALYGAGPIAAIDSLAAGGSSTKTFTHVVTAADVEAGKVVNTAELRYPVSSDESDIQVFAAVMTLEANADPGYAVVKSNTVESPTGAEELPTLEPTGGPTLEPTGGPTLEPTGGPTLEPTGGPTLEPTGGPTLEPTTEPTLEPTTEPTIEPTAVPTVAPTAAPTAQPTDTPIPPANLPRTGDNSQTGMWIAFALASLCVMVGIGVAGKKGKYASKHSK